MSKSNLEGARFDGDRNLRFARQSMLGSQDRFEKSKVRVDDGAIRSLKDTFRKMRGMQKGGFKRAFEKMFGSKQMPAYVAPAFASVLVTLYSLGLAPDAFANEGSWSDDDHQKDHYPGADNGSWDAPTIYQDGEYSQTWLDDLSDDRLTEELKKVERKLNKDPNNSSMQKRLDALEAEQASRVDEAKTAETGPKVITVGPEKTSDDNLKLLIIKFNELGDDSHMEAKIENGLPTVTNSCEINGVKVDCKFVQDSKSGMNLTGRQLTESMEKTQFKFTFPDGSKATIEVGISTKVSAKVDGSEKMTWSEGSTTQEVENLDGSKTETITHIEFNNLIGGDDLKVSQEIEQKTQTNRDGTAIVTTKRLVYEVATGKLLKEVSTVEKVDPKGHVQIEEVVTKYDFVSGKVIGTDKNSRVQGYQEWLAEKAKLKNVNDLSAEERSAMKKVLGNETLPTYPINTK